MPQQDPFGRETGFIAPFWADVDISKGGEVQYVLSRSTDLLDKATRQIRSAIYTADADEFTATSLFFVTWKDVRYHGSTDDNYKVMKLITGVATFHM